MGLWFLGMALGPTLGGFLVRCTGNLLVPFYFATCMHLLYAISLLVIVPESLTREQMEGNRNSHAAKVEQTRLANSDRPILARFKFIFESLGPLTLFLSPPNRKGGNPMKPKKDWSLLLIALSYGGAVMLIVSTISSEIVTLTLTYLDGRAHTTISSNILLRFSGGSPNRFVLDIVSSSILQ